MARGPHDEASALRAVLDRVGRLAGEGRLPVVVLDLDSTLFSTSARHHRILSDWAETREEPELRALCARVREEDFGWGVEEPLRALGLADELHLADLRAFWSERFFTSAYCMHDRPAPGAPAYARRLLEQGALLYYLTGRPTPEMAPGTVHSLTTHGFPVLRGRAVLHMKPSSHLSDDRFKQHALEEVRALRGEVVATFENEPGHAARFLAAFPGATHFLFGAVHSPEAPDPHPELVRIGSFHV